LWCAKSNFNGTLPTSLINAARPAHTPVCTSFYASSSILVLVFEKTNTAIVIFAEQASDQPIEGLKLEITIVMIVHWPSLVHLCDWVIKLDHNCVVFYSLPKSVLTSDVLLS
jgi:hypothetical protein